MFSFFFPQHYIGTEVFRNVYENEEEECSQCLNINVTVRWQAASLIAVSPYQQNEEIKYLNLWDFNIG